MKKNITIQNTDHVPMTKGLIIPRYKVEMLWFMANSHLERSLHPWKNCILGSMSFCLMPQKLLQISYTFTFPTICVAIFRILIFQSN